LIRKRIITGNLRVAQRELWFYSLESQWIRACGGTLPCCNNSEKGSLGFWKNKNEKEKNVEKRKKVHKK
jgi:hypothetical protein